MRYLGIDLDSKISFTYHVRKVANASTVLSAVISRLMPNVGEIQYEMQVHVDCRSIKAAIGMEVCRPNYGSDT